MERWKRHLRATRSLKAKVEVNCRVMIDVDDAKDASTTVPALRSRVEVVIRTHCANHKVDGHVVEVGNSSVANDW